jgi:hypothetical protein
VAQRHAGFLHVAGSSHLQHGGCNKYCYNQLGAQVILVGIAPDMAQTIVQLGVDLSSIITCSKEWATVRHGEPQRRR